MDNQQATRKAIASHELKISSQEQEISSLKKTVNSQHKEITNLRNVQTGVIDCGGDTGYTGSLPTWNGAHDTYKTRTVTFAEKYLRAPEVHLSFGFVDEHSHAYFRNELVSVSTTGFIMRCRSYYSTPVQYMMVNWISVPQ